MAGYPLKVGDKVLHRFPYCREAIACTVKLVVGEMSRVESSEETGLQSAWVNTFTGQSVRWQIRDIPVAGQGVDINAWINDQIDKRLSSRGTINATDAANIARSAALSVIADRETLIANLRAAGYTVPAPPADAMSAENGR